MFLDQADTALKAYLAGGDRKAFRKARYAAYVAEGATRTRGTPAQFALAQWLYGHVVLFGHLRGHAAANTLEGGGRRLRAVVGNPAIPEDLRLAAVDGLAAILLARHETTGEISHLHDIRVLVTGALASLPAGTPAVRRGVYLVHLGVTDLTIARHTGNAALAGAAARQLADAVDVLPEGSHEHALAAAQAANAELTAAQLAGRLPGRRETADALVEVARRAVEAADRLGSEAQADVLGPGAPYLHLGQALCLRFDARRDREDLAEAERSIGRALDLVPEDNAARPIYLLARGSVAVRRYRAADRASDTDADVVGAHLDRAVADLEDAVRLLPRGARDRGLYLGNLAEGRQLRYQHDMRRTADLDEALRRARQAVAAAGAQAAAAGPLLNLCVIRVLVHERSRQGFGPVSLAAAEADLTRLLRDLPPDHPQVAAAQHVRGRLYASVFRRSERQADLDTALAAYTAAARHESGTASRRGSAAEAGGLLAHRNGRPDTAADLLDLALELLEAMTEPTLLGWYSRVDHIEHFGGLARHACAAHLAAGRAEDALAALDRGRGLLLAPVWGLASRAADLPEEDLKLYREAVWSSFRADQAGEAVADPFVAGPLAPAGPPAEGAYADPREHRRAAGRILAAHASRLAPRGVDLRALSARLGTRAAVALNVTALRADALIVTSHGVEAVRLPGLTADEAESYAQRLHRVVVDHSRESLAVLDELTRRLWDAVAAPVLEGLKQLGPDRVLWVPSGPLSLLPVHAAGHHGAAGPGKAQDTVLDRVVSSYSVTLRALERDLSRPTEPTGPALLVAPGRSGRMGRVTVPAPLFDEPGALRLYEEQAVPPAVLASLPGRAVVHFACHGENDPADPVASCLHLAGGERLPFVDVARSDLGAARLAFLAACDTAVTGERFADEAVHMASAFQLAGFPHVIGSLWRVYGHLAVSVARDLYAEIDKGVTPALALHKSVLALRDAQADSGADLGPLAWAPFIHLGT